MNLSHTKMSAIEKCPYRGVLSVNHPRRMQGEEQDGGLLRVNTIVGNAVHESISRFIDRWVDDRQHSPNFQDIFESDARQEIESNWQEPNENIFEYRMGLMSLDDDGNLSRKQKSKAERAIRNFIRYWGFYEMGQWEYVQHEEARRIDLEEGHSLTAIIDFHAIDGEGFHRIIDWKTGRVPPGRIGNGQLGIYARMVHERRNVPLEQILVQFISLTEENRGTSKVKERDLIRVQRRINRILEFSEMEDDEENKIRLAMPSDRNCGECSFTHNCDFYIPPGP